MSQFVIDIKKIRDKARESLQKGAVTDSNRADCHRLIELLDSALATEWICVLRYTQHAAVATGLHSETIAKHFMEHAKEEAQHAHQIAERINQLGGKPNLDPKHFPDSAHSYYVECDSLLEMIKENLIAERIAIMSYTEMIRFVGEDDPTTRRMLEGILEVEEEHADELAKLIDRVDFREKQEDQNFLKASGSEL